MAFIHEARSTAAVVGIAETINAIRKASLLEVLERRLCLGLGFSRWSGERGGEQSGEDDGNLHDFEI